MSETIGYLSAAAAFIASGALLLLHIRDLEAKIESAKSRVDRLENTVIVLTNQTVGLAENNLKQAELIHKLSKVIEA